MSTKSGTTSSGRSSSTNSLNQQPQQSPREEASRTRSGGSGDDDEPKARLCHLKKWAHFQGYGFNLHAERSRLGQHIGKVDANSPAESAGLREGDRIIEVNLVNISNENHQQVVKRIRSGLERDGETHEDEVLLLVVDRHTDEWFKSRGIVVRSSNPDQVVRLETVEHHQSDDLHSNAAANDEDGDEHDDQDEHHQRHSSQSENDHNNNAVAPLGGSKDVESSPQSSPSLKSGDEKKELSAVSVSAPVPAHTPSPEIKNKLSSSSNSSLNGTPSQLPSQSQTVSPKSITPSAKQVNIPTITRIVLY